MRFGKKIKSGFVSIFQKIRKVVCCKFIPKDSKEKDDELKTI